MRTNEITSYACVLRKRGQPVCLASPLLSVYMRESLARLPRSRQKLVRSHLPG